VLLVMKRPKEPTQGISTGSSVSRNCGRARGSGWGLTNPLSEHYK
jgi:hypothetical protein